MAESPVSKEPEEVQSPKEETPAAAEEAVEEEEVVEEEEASFNYHNSQYKYLTKIK